MRLFAAVPLPEAVQRGLAEVGAELRGLFGASGPRLTWTKPGNQHLTLKFLGEVPERAAGDSSAPFVPPPAASDVGPDRDTGADVGADTGTNVGPVPATVAAVRAALERVRFAPFAFRPGGGGVFPDRRRPRVLWVGLAEGAEAAAALAAAVQAALVPLGFAPESRPFAPHLTLARVRDRVAPPGRADWPAALRRLNSRVWPRTTAAEFVLFRSELTPAGPRYTRLLTIPAQGGAARSPLS